MAKVFESIPCERPMYPIVNTMTAEAPFMNMD